MRSPWLLLAALSLSPLGCALVLSYDGYGPAGETGGGGTSASSSSSSSSSGMGGSTSSSSSSSSGNLKNCENGLLDQGEQSVDCGGVCPLACPVCDAVSVAFVAAPDTSIGHGGDFLKIVDYNGDDHLDVVISSLAVQSLTAVTGTGDGTFMFFNEGIYPGIGAFTIGPFDVDGAPDMAATVPTGLGILLNSSFAKGEALTNLSLMASPNVVVTGDFDGDLHADLAWIAPGSPVVSLLQGSGVGSFAAATAYTFAASAKPVGLLAADLVGDGVTDLMISDIDKNKVYIVLVGPQASFVTVQRDVGAPSGSMVAGDFDGDGKMDIAVGSTIGGAITVLLDASNVMTGTSVTSLVDISASNLAAADFNKDGRLDLAVSGSDSSIQVLLGNGDGSFTSGPQLSMPAGPVVLDTADVNGDGRVDIVAVSGNADVLKVFLNQCL